jgi:hypothetical protein
MDNFNPFGPTATVARTVCEDLLEQVKAGKAFRLLGSDTKDGANAETLQAVRDGSLAAVHYSASIGNGRGSTRLDLTGDQIAPVLEALRAWDPAEDLSALSPAECVRRTIAAEGDDVTFKLSLASNSRKVKIPAPEWPAFVDFIESVGGWSESALAHYASELAKVEASAE